MPPEKLNWNNIIKDACPKDGLPLVAAMSGKGFECSGVRSTVGSYCNFFVTKEKLEQLKKNARNARYRRR